MAAELQRACVLPDSTSAELNECETMFLKLGCWQKLVLLCRISGILVGPARGKVKDVIDDQVDLQIVQK